MNPVLNYLYKKDSINSYMIRGILNHVHDFKYEIEIDDHNNVTGILGIWEEEKIATIRGDVSFAKKWVNKLWGGYDFCDLEFSLFNDLFKDVNLLDKCTITNYYVLEYFSNTMTENPKLTLFREVHKNDWMKINEIYTKCYGKTFADFQEDNMLWFTTYEEDYPISNICLERVTDEFYVLSNFYTIPDKRGMGVGTNLLKSVINGFENTKFCLFVEKSNTTALNIYNKIDFRIIGDLVNIETI